MFLRQKTTVSALVIGLIAGAGLTFAQQPQSNNSAPPVPQPGQLRTARRGMRERAGARGPRVIEQLNLTDAQRQQARAIMQANRERTRAQRLEMRQLNQQWRQGTLTADSLEKAKALRVQLAESRRAEREQMMNLLTTEQKTKLQELRQARRANHERFGRRKRPVE